MNALSRHHLGLGARLAPDGIPLHYGDLAAEFAAASSAAILLDRSHEGRILITGRDRLALVNRMSTNEVESLAVGEGAPTLFTNANARILFRAVCYHRPEGLLLISEAGQGPALANLLRRNIFFGDQASVNDISAGTAHFALHGGAVEAVIAGLPGDLLKLPAWGSAAIEVAQSQVTVLRRKAICGGHWSLISSAESAAALHQHLLSSGAEAGLQPAGSLTYNSLRIRGGRPAGLELSLDYMPVEVGLWDEVSFSKGCYTGQEILARLESRERLAKTLVKIALSDFLPAPAPIYAGGRQVGQLTSSAQAADGRVYALAVLRLGSAAPGSEVQVGPAGLAARVSAYAGAQPPFIAKATENARRR